MKDDDFKYIQEMADAQKKSDETLFCKNGNKRPTQLKNNMSLIIKSWLKNLFTHKLLCESKKKRIKMKRKVELLLMAMALIVLAIIFLQETTTKCVLLVVLIVLQVITEKEIKEN